MLTLLYPDIMYTSIFQSSQKLVEYREFILFILQQGQGLSCFWLGFGTLIYNYKIIICLIEQVSISLKYIALPKYEKTSAFNIAYKIRPLHKK